ncbi:hypothetical protein ABPG72_015498 [Tetrahymena utriculariae]
MYNKNLTNYVQAEQGIFIIIIILTLQRIYIIQKCQEKQSKIQQEGRMLCVQRGSIYKVFQKQNYICDRWIEDSQFSIQGLYKATYLFDQKQRELCARQKIIIKKSKLKIILKQIGKQQTTQ